MRSDWVEIPSGLMERLDKERELASKESGRIISSREMVGMALEALLIVVERIRADETSPDVYWDAFDELYVAWWQKHVSRKRGMINNATQDRGGQAAAESLPPLG
jgi:hypothetical protein